MAGPLASIRPVHQSALGANRVDRGLAARLGSLANAVNQGLDSAGAGITGDVELAQLFAAGLLGGVEGVTGAGGDPAAGLAHQPLLGFAFRQQGRDQGAKRQSAAKSDERRSVDLVARPLPSTVISIDRP